jgi:hypothetical protein
LRSVWDPLAEGPDPLAEEADELDEVEASELI